MKKFGKFILGLTAVAAAVAGVAYFLKNILMKDYLDDYDDDDFDNDLYDDEDDRDYVTITPDNSKADMTDETEDTEESDESEEESESEEE